MEDYRKRGDRNGRPALISTATLLQHGEQIYFTATRLPLTM